MDVKKVSKFARSHSGYFENESVRSIKKKLFLLTDQINQSKVCSDDMLNFLDYLDNKSFESITEVDFLKVLALAIYENSSSDNLDFLTSVYEKLYSKILRGEIKNIKNLLNLFLWAKEHASVVGSLVHLANVCKLISQVYFYNLENEDAVKYGNLSLEIFVTLSHTEEIAYLAMYLGDLCIKLLDWVQAQKMYNLAQKCFYQCGLYQGSVIAEKRKDIARSSYLDTLEYNHAKVHWLKDRYHPNVYHLQKLR